MSNTQEKLVKLKNALDELCNNAKLIPNPFDIKGTNLYAIKIKDLHAILENKEVLKNINI
tara:strand:- start:3441 stop:3620 length:180 start_codon:yes stop_codon:yes gene_type:complete